MFDRGLKRFLDKWDEDARKRDEEAARRDEEAARRDEEAARREKEARKRQEEYEAVAEETREFNREILLRNEKVYTAVIAEMEEHRLEIRKTTEQIEEGTKQLRANTQAVLSVLDRLNGSSA